MYVLKLRIRYFCASFRSSLLCLYFIQEKLVVEPGTPNGNSSDTNTPGEATTTTSSSTSFGFPQFPNKVLNKQIALVSTLAAVGLFLSSRLDFGVSLKDLSAVALPYEQVCDQALNLIYVLYWCCFLIYTCNVLDAILGSFQWEAYRCGILR